MAIGQSCEDYAQGEEEVRRRDAKPALPKESVCLTSRLSAFKRHKKTPSLSPGSPWLSVQGPGIAPGWAGYEPAGSLDALLPAWHLL